MVDESDGGVEKPRHPPRLGEIEQLSTETQTDEFDALMGSVGQGKPSASHSGSNAQTLPSQPSPEDPEDPFGSHVGMPEDVLDILCSNYTQTCAGTPNTFTLWCRKKGMCGKRVMVAHLGCVLCLKRVMTAHL